jgi:hypothetical protein
MSKSKHGFRFGFRAKKVGTVFAVSKTKVLMYRQECSRYYPKVTVQGGQIGRIFAYWGLFSLVSVFLNYINGPNVKLFFNVKVINCF